jgi:hypothetical protein
MAELHPALVAAIAHLTDNNILFGITAEGLENGFTMNAFIDAGLVYPLTMTMYDPAAQSQSNIIEYAEELKAEELARLGL